MSNEHTPLVSDEQMGHLLGRKAVRDIYEARYQQDAATIAALRAEVEALKVAGNAMCDELETQGDVTRPGEARQRLFRLRDAWTALTTKTD